MPSERKLEANCRNAQHSTGPITPESRAAFSLNAPRLGLHARDRVLPDQEHRLATPEEYFLVQGAAHWRLHRLIRMDTGQYAGEIDLHTQAPDDPSAPPLLGVGFSKPAAPVCSRPGHSDNMPPLNDLRLSARTNPPFRSNAAPAANSTSASSPGNTAGTVF